MQDQNTFPDSLRVTLLPVECEKRGRWLAKIFQFFESISLENTEGRWRLRDVVYARKVKMFCIISVEERVLEPVPDGWQSQLNHVKHCFG